MGIAHKLVQWEMLIKLQSRPRESIIRTSPHRVPPPLRGLSIGLCHTPRPAWSLDMRPLTPSSPRAVAVRSRKSVRGARFRLVCVSARPRLISVLTLGAWSSGPEYVCIERADCRAETCCAATLRRRSWCVMCACQGGGGAHPALILGS